jgi:hypothetical protein
VRTKPDSRFNRKTDRSRGMNSARRAGDARSIHPRDRGIERKFSECCASSFERNAVRANSLTARKRKRKAARCACAVNDTRVKVEENRKEGSIDDNEPEISRANAHVHVAPLGKLIRIA